MNWLDESRRNAFERAESARAHVRAGSVDRGVVVGRLDRLRPEVMKRRALAIGNELILSYDDALAAIRLATQHQVAVLGFDAGEVVADGFRIADYSAYKEVPFTGDWKAYAAAMNAIAEQWIKEHPLGENYGYILTSTSQEEFAKPDVRKNAVEGPR